MSRSTAQTSNLQLSVEPSQSSFFAGEEFRCVITFTNTLEPTPHSVPLPSTATFDKTDHADRRVVSVGPGALQSQEKASNPAISNILAQHRRKHSKSQSVDVRTFARQNQLQPFEGAEEDVGSEEVYYKKVAAEKERDNDEARDLYLKQELFQNLPARRHLVGNRRSQYLLAESCGRKKENDSSFAGPSTSTPARRHQKAYSEATTSRQHQNLGIGPAPDVRIESPQEPSQHILLQANTPTSSPSRNTSSSLRRPSGPISAAHPHGRKKSVAQVQAEDLSSTFELEGGGADSSTSMDNTPTQSGAVTPRESVDVRGKGSGFYGLDDNSTMESVLREDFTQWSRMNPNGRGRSDSSSSSMTATSSSGWRNGTSSETIVSPLFDSRSPQAPGTESILWSFAQFGGNFQIDESLIKPGEFEQVKEKLAGPMGGPRPAGASIPFSPVGGGELGSVDVGQDERSAEGWGSYLRSALFMGNGRQKSNSLAVPASHRRTGSTLGDMRTKTLASRSIPIFSNPPSMIAVDLKVAPGESKSYTFSIPLPPDLPPSYAGRCISFAYTLTLGINRLAKSKKGTLEQKSRLVRIPLRVYNMVHVSGVTSFFDLTNPIVNLKDLADVSEEDQLRPVTMSGSSSISKDVGRRDSKIKEYARSKDLLQYTQQLIASCKEEEEDDVPTDVEVATELARKHASKDGEGRHSSNSPHKRTHLQLLPDMITIKNGIVGGGSSGSGGGSGSRGSASLMLDSNAGLGLGGNEEDDLPTTSLQAVELLSRNSPKVSYDISKDGQIAAVLTLVKSKYRLGDTVHGVVTINLATSIARVVRFAATLETHEEIEATLCTLPPARAQRMTRKIHAEFHENTLDSGQVGFSLPIPSGATPDFVTSAVRLSWTVRLSFLMLSTVRQSDKVPRPKPPSHLVPVADDGFSAYHHTFRAVKALAGPYAQGQASNVPEAKLEVVECAVPLTVLAHSTRFTAGEVAFTA